ncbi:MAG: sulfatase-like hydrolase/transferase [Methanobacteriota archaeon]
MRRLVSSLLVLFLIPIPFVAGDPPSTEDPSAPARPNVLIIVTDDHRKNGTLEFMPKTMKWFRDEGREFSEGYTIDPICCPARAGVWTGQYTQNHNVITTADAGIVDEDGSIQRYVHDAGYKTAAFGKFFNSYPLTRTPKHFDDWAFHASGYTQVRFNDHGVQRTVPLSQLFIRERALGFLATTESNDTQPWYLYLAPYAPHGPWIPEQKYANEIFPPWLGNPATLDVDRSDKPNYIQTTVPLVSAAAGVPHERLPESVSTLTSVATSVPFDRQTYLRPLLTVDDNVDMIMTQLAAQGELNNTIAFFFSDQGYLWGEHGWYNKVVPYTHAIEIPFFVRYPGVVPAGTVPDRIASQVDVLPTILDAADLPANATKNHDGRSLLNDSWERPFAFAEFWTQGIPAGNAVPHWATIRSKDWQYVEYYTGNQRVNPTVSFREYYDLTTDPWQLENRFSPLNILSPVEAARASALHDMLQATRLCRGTTGANPCP